MIKNPNQIIEEDKASMTYREVYMYSEIFAKKLTDQNICIIYCSSEMSEAIALLSCIAAGVTAVPLSVRYGEAHFRKMLTLFSPSCIITDTDGELQVHRIYTPKEKHRPDENRPALIMCTSGTTGTPKGIMLSGRNIMTNLKDIASYFKIGSGDTVLITRPLYHCAVLTGEFLTALIKGSKIIFYSKEFNPLKTIELLKTKKVSVFGATPTIFNIISHFMRSRDRINLTSAVISGECMSRVAAQNIRKAFPNTNIYHVYGLTEAGPRVSYMPPEYFDKAPDCVGIPLPSVKTEIRDGSGNIVPEGERGILWVKGENVMLGYYCAPEQTARVLREGWLCTGDVAEITKDGWLRIIGRNDDMIIRAGMNIYPQEIEAELKRDKRTKEALIYGFGGEKQETRIGLKISGDYKNTGEVVKLCKKVLPAFQIPSEIEIVSDLPKNISGKVIRKKRNGRV